MKILFNKAPLLELIAEVRWLPAGTITPAAPQPTAVAQFVFPTDAKVEEFFMRLGGELYQSGFQRSERLVPPGFPMVLGQPAIRYRSDDAVKKSVLYQAGSSVFSVHAVPPYRSWDDFAPHVHRGIEALTKIREASPFTQASLRYLDFFGQELMGGRTARAFISEVLNFNIKLPEPLMQAAEPKEVQSQFLKFVLPLRVGLLNVSVADGVVNNQNGVVMDTTVTTFSLVEAKIEDVMRVFNSAHEIIHETFLGLVKPIERLMEPQQMGA